jgi:hypothetical protein
VVLRARTLDFPYASSLRYARLAGLGEEIHGQWRERRDFVVDYDELQLRTPPELILEQGKPLERVEGVYVPRRLRFLDVPPVELTGPYARLTSLPADHPARFLRGTHHWRPTGRTVPLHLFISNESSLILPASRWKQEERAGAAAPAAFLHDWSPAPPIPPRLIPATKAIHRRYGGDPVTIHLGTRVHHQRLFVGGLECQGPRRPQVDAVLNLGEWPSRWVDESDIPAADRRVQRGEGRAGMAAGEIAEEAGWVVERLRAGSRVLVHCVAGFNRSVTVCCGVLILLEGLMAEAALARVHEHHPWARPDSHHWLRLRWLAQR